MTEIASNAQKQDHQCAGRRNLQHVAEGRGQTVTQSRTVHVLISIRRSLHYLVFGLLPSWDLLYLLFAPENDPRLGRAVCDLGANVSFLVPRQYASTVATQCAAGTGEPSISLLAFLLQLSLAVVLGVVSLVLYAVLLAFWSRAPEPRLIHESPLPNPNISIGTVFACVCALPVIPIVGTLYLLEVPGELTGGFSMNLVYSSCALLAHGSLAMALRLILAIRRALKGRSIDLPPGL